MNGDSKIRNQRISVASDALDVWAVMLTPSLASCEVSCVDGGPGITVV